MLDAAERLFAENGFDGTSIRDITTSAKVEVGLAVYHFKTKAELFRETLGRRAPEFAQMLTSAHGSLSDEARLSPRDIVAAYFDAHMTLAHSDDPGWRSYLRLAAVAMLRGDDGELSKDARSVFRPAMLLYEQMLISACPTIDAEEIRRIWAICRRSVISVLIGDSQDQYFRPENSGAMRQTFIEVFSRSFS